MVDPDLIDGYPSNIRLKIREALSTLASTGVLAAQRTRLFARIAEGSDSEDCEVLAKRILDYRAQSHTLLALEQLGESIQEEQDHDDTDEN